MASLPPVPMCSNCDSIPCTVECSDCHSSFCHVCDPALHEPVKMRSHARFPYCCNDYSVMLDQAFASGRRSDFGAQNAAGCLMQRFVLEDARGFWYAFKNDSPAWTLDAELSFSLVNFVLDRFPADVKCLRIFLPAGSATLFRIIKIQQDKASDCHLTQRFAILPYQNDQVASITVPVRYDHYTPLDTLKAVTEHEGVHTEYGKNNPAAVGIHQFQWETHGMYCFLFKNQSSDTILHREFEFSLTNMAISGKEAEERNVAFDLLPGQTEFLVLRELTAAEPYSMTAKSSYYVKPVKAVGS